MLSLLYLHEMFLYREKVYMMRTSIDSKIKSSQVEYQV